MEQRGMEQNNEVLLRGTLAAEPVYSHESHGLRFDRLLLGVERLSGTVDTLPVLAGHGLVEALEPRLGDALEVRGQLRSWNDRGGAGRRLVLSVLAGSMTFTARDPENQVRLLGQLCREPVFRRTPLGREISDVMLAVERPYGRRDYLPCILWGSLARMAAACEKGDGLAVEGRFQSRTYWKQTEAGPEARIAYEVSAITAERA